MARCHTLLSVFWGRTRTLNFCGFRAFRGRIRIPWGKNTKRAWRNAMPSYEFILWVHRLLGWCTSCSGKRQSRAETSAPPDKHPLKDYLTSTFLTLPSAVRTMFRPFWSLLSLTPLTVKNSTSPSATVVALIPVSGSLGAVQSLSTTLT